MSSRRAGVHRRLSCLDGELVIRGRGVRSLLMAPTRWARTRATGASSTACSTAR